jgi:hypothetical protein
VKGARASAWLAGPRLRSTGVNQGHRRLPHIKSRAEVQNPESGGSTGSLTPIIRLCGPAVASTPNGLSPHGVMPNEFLAPAEELYQAYHDLPARSPPS